MTASSNVTIIEMTDKLNPTCFTAGRPGDIKLVVCHNTEGPNDINSPALDHQVAITLSDQAAAYLCSNDRQVSAHYLIGAEAAGPRIYHVCRESNVAYHAGGSSDHPTTWHDPDTGEGFEGFSLNQGSIGVELFGSHTDLLGPNQMEALETLFLDYIPAGQNVAPGIFGRHPQLKDTLRLMTHKRLESWDRSDGTNWVEFLHDLSNR